MWMMEALRLVSALCYREDSIWVERITSLGRVKKKKPKKKKMERSPRRRKRGDR